MKTSEQVKEIFAALAAFQGQVKNPEKSAIAEIRSDKGNYSYRYATLPEMLNDVRPLLSKNGLAIIQESSGREGLLTETTLITHSSGQWIMLDALEVPYPGTLQKAGGVITYLRRYTLGGALGTAGEDDTDAVAADATPKKPVAKPKAKSPQKGAERTPGGASIKSCNFAFSRFRDAGITNGATEGISEADNLRREAENNGAVTEWLITHGFEVKDDSEPLDNLDQREISTIIDDLNQVIVEKNQDVPY
jgi:hypothetical protein